MSSEAPVTPTTSRVATTSGIQAPSPHYVTTRRHSLYGTEDRIVIDPGSRVWKVGFSGEGRPREVFTVSDSKTGAPLWPDVSGKSTAERDDALITLENKLQDILRNVFFELLLVDPRSRKVIIVEHPLIPLVAKDALVRVLFLNIQVLSVSFAPNHLLALLSSGRLSGLVLDCGNLDSVALPIYGSRPLYSCLRSSPLAGSRLNQHLRSLILKHAKYMPPIGVVSSATPQATAVPEDVITDAVLDDVKTRICFVGDPMSSRPTSPAPSTAQGTGTGEDSMSESEGRRSESSMSMDVDRPRAPGLSHPPSSSASSSRSRRREARTSPDRLRDLYVQQSRATELTLRIAGPSTTAPGAVVSRAGLRVPGWIRERAAEVLFEYGDVDEAGCAELILDSLLKAPLDLRKELSSSILVAGGTAMLPGFISRLHFEILRLLEPPAELSDPTDIAAGQDDRQALSASPTTPKAGASFPAHVGVPPSTSTGKRRRSVHDPYETLRPLAPYIAILNHPSPPTSFTQSSMARKNAGKAPGFAPAALPWVGASLAGALKTDTDEIIRELWEEAYEEALLPSPLPSLTATPAGTPGPAATPKVSTRLAASGAAIAAVVARRLKVDVPGGTAHLLPDWTRPPMRQGAPSVYATG